MNHPMRVVMRRTGLSADVLRAWEKRYKAVDPGRSEGGQRLYSDDDVDRLVLLQRVTALGRNISQVAALRADQLRRLLLEDESALELPPAPNEDRTADRVRAEAMDLVDALDGPELEKALRRGALRLGVDALVERAIVPLLRELGERCSRGEVTPAHEQVAGGVVQRVLQWIGETSSRIAGAPCITLATTEGERDELGIQIVAAVAATEAWRVNYLGGDLAADAIVRATRQTESQVLALSFGSPGSARDARAPLGTIRASLSPGVAVIAGGAGAAETEADLSALGITVLPSLGELRAFLRSYA
ncbi:MAG TPA: MerR family transcriptional regulator [Gemmatimonadales bacterium]|nr:MerR family transcriptional regulator [Gemmatimonadales bacterium]